MTDLGPLQVFLGPQVNQDDSSIKLSQTKYERYLLVRFHMIDYNFAAIPFLSKVSLEDGGDTTLVDNTLY
jgi:hypothetical protein